MVDGVESLVELLAALRNAAKSLLAVVRAGEKVQELRKRLLSAINDKDRLGIELPGITIEILGEQCDAASDALDSALATLKETTL